MNLKNRELLDHSFPAHEFFIGRNCQLFRLRPFLETRSYIGPEISEMTSPATWILGDFVPVI
jgi:hypothetical protein